MHGGRDRERHVDGRVDIWRGARDSPFVSLRVTAASFEGQRRGADSSSCSSRFSSRSVVVVVVPIFCPPDRKSVRKTVRRAYIMPRFLISAMHRRSRAASSLRHSSASFLSSRVARLNWCTPKATGATTLQHVAPVSPRASRFSSRLPPTLKDVFVSRRLFFA